MEQQEDSGCSENMFELIIELNKLKDVQSHIISINQEIQNCCIGVNSNW